MKVNLDDLSGKTVAELADLALRLDDRNSFWLLTGYITGKLPRGHPAQGRLWNAAHGDPAAELEAYEAARRVCEELKA